MGYINIGLNFGKWDFTYPRPYLTLNLAYFNYFFQTTFKPEQGIRSKVTILAKENLKSYIPDYEQDAVL